MRATSFGCWSPTGEEIGAAMLRTRWGMDVKRTGRYLLPSACSRLELGVDLHGINELLDPVETTNYLVASLVLAFAFVHEGVSFGQAFRQARKLHFVIGRDSIEEAVLTLATRGEESMVSSLS